MSWPENRLIDINLPEFILNFNNNCISLLVPFIEAAIKYVENAENPILFILLLILLVQILRTSLMTLPEQQKQATNNTQARQISKQVKDLKRELKSIQNMIIQIKNANPLRQNHSFQNVESSRKLIESCKESWRKREELASEISDWQLKLIKEVIILKNKNRSSRSKVSLSSTKQLSLPANKTPQSTQYIRPEKVETIKKPLFKSQIKDQQTKKIQTFIESSVSVIKQQRENSQMKIETTVVEQKKQTKVQISENSSSLSVTQQVKIEKYTQNQSFKPEAKQIQVETKYLSEREPPKSTAKFYPPKTIGKATKVPVPVRKVMIPPPKTPKNE